MLNSKNVYATKNKQGKEFECYRMIIIDNLINGLWLGSKNSAETWKQWVNKSCNNSGNQTTNQREEQR